MINATELRIGNYVNFLSPTYGGYYQVASIDEDQLSLNNFYVEYHLVEPIPLTEEWLLKFGFTKEYEGSTYAEDDAYFSPFNRVRFAMKPYTYTDGSIWFDLQIEFNIAIGYNDFLRPPEYVHELQNLYFAITGTELTIKEPVK